MENGKNKEAKEEKIQEKIGASFNKIGKRKEKVKKWLKDPYNLGLLAILIFAFVVRLYYFDLTKDQPLWWDEAAYGSMAKNYVSHIWDGTEVIKGENLIRPPFLPLLWSILIRAGFDETINRFILLFIPSVLTIFFVYLIGKELYDKRTGLFSAFIFSVLWMHLFYSSRLLTHILSLAFLFASIFFFIKANQLEKFNYTHLSIAMVLAGIVALIRYPDGLVYGVYAIFLLLVRRFELIKDRKAWIAAILGLVPMWIFFLINYIKSGNIFPALLGSNYVRAVSKSFAFDLLKYIQTYLTTTFFLLFIIGLGFTIFELVIGYGIISKNKKLQGYLFMILFFVVFYSFFIFVIRGSDEGRWLFPLSIAFVSFAGAGISSLYTFVRKYERIFAVVLVITLLTLGAYSQIKFANTTISNSRNSFLQAKQGYEWLRENTEKDAVIMSSGLEVLAMYYAERENIGFPQNVSDMDEVTVDYLAIHAYKPEAHPSYLNDYLQNNQDKWKPVQVFFADQEGKQPVFVIYRGINNANVM